MATCTAPGTTCTITCQNGCGAIYFLPDGPCKTFCSGDKCCEGEAFDKSDKLSSPLAPSTLISIQVNELPAEKLGVAFNQCLPHTVVELLKTSKVDLSFSLNSTTIDQLINTIKNELQGSKE